MELALGTVLCGKYELVRLLGRGGSSHVFEARHLALSKQVAVKVLPLGHGASAILARREALAGSIRSNNVVDIYDIDQDPAHDVVVIVMELLEGASLERLLAEGRRLSEDETVTVLRQMLAGIQRAHERGIVHGDLKPGNVYCIDRIGEERVVLLDFGIASLQATEPSAMTATVGGTPLWMNVEAIQGADRTWRADTWAIGLLAFRMLTGRFYWRCDNANELILEIVNGPKELASRVARQVGVTVPDWLDAFFTATVNDDTTRLLRARDLLGLLPDRPTRVPHMGEEASTAPSIVGNVDVLGTTAITVAASPPSPMAVPVVIDPSLHQSLRAVLPGTMHASVSTIGSFVESLFARWEVDGSVLRLRGPKLDFARGFEFFLVGMAQERRSSLLTKTFIWQTQGLEDILGQLDPAALKVVIVLLETTDLGIGARARIAELFRTHRAALIPALVGDIAPLDEDAARAWLKSRWQANRPMNNPFEPRVVDRMLLRGQDRALNQFIEALCDKPSAFGVYGGPGSGKTSIVRRSEMELQTETNFHWITCGMLPDGNLAKGILRRAAETFKVPFEVVDGRPVDAFTTGLSGALAKARDQARRVVVVLDEADAVIDPTLARDPEDRQFLCELRQQMTGFLAQSAASFVFVGLRGFMLGHEQVGGALNPLRRFFRPVRVPPLQLDEMHDLCALGRQVDLHFEKRAVERVQHWSSGNVNVAQMICSRLLEVAVGRETTTVSDRMVDDTARELIAARQSFERRVMPWLTEPEKRVLSAVPRIPFKRPYDLAAVLPELTDETIGNTLDSLVEMGVLARTGRKTQVANRLLDEWVLTHMGPPKAAVAMERERNVRWATGGVALTCLLYVVGSFAFAAGEKVAVVKDPSQAHGCTTRALFPERVMAHQDVKVMLSRRCNEWTSTELVIGPAEGTFGAKKTLQASKELPPTIVLEDVYSTGPTVDMEISVDGTSEIVHLKHNWWGAIPAVLRNVVLALGALPAVLGVLVSFYGDVRKLVGKAWSRSDPADS